MVDSVNQNVKVDSGGFGFWLFLVLAVVLVFLAVMFQGRSPPLAGTPQQPVVPEGIEIIKDRDGRVVGIKPLRRL